MSWTRRNGLKEMRRETNTFYIQVVGAISLVLGHIHCGQMTRRRRLVTNDYVKDQIWKGLASHNNGRAPCGGLKTDLESEIN